LAVARKNASTKESWPMPQIPMQQENIKLTGEEGSATPLRRAREKLTKFIANNLNALI
jgi:hypothetical protein